MIKFKPNSYRLHIAFSLNGLGNKNFDTAALKEGQYSKVVIRQKLMFGNDYRYSISVNGEEVFMVVNKQAMEFPDVKLYAGDTFYEPSNCYIRNLRFKNLGRETQSIATFFFHYEYQKTLINSQASFVCLYTNPLYTQSD